MTNWDCNPISARAGSSRVWAVRSPSFCRLPPRAMEHLHAQLQAAAEGHLPPEEPLAAEVAAMPLALGADGVMVPFRPEGGDPRGKTAWHEVKVGVLARLGRHRTRTGEMVARLHQRRLV